MNLQDALTDAGFRAGWAALKVLPEPAAQRLFRRVADRTWSRQGQSVLQLKANLARVLDDNELAHLDDITHDAVRAYMRYWCEVFRQPLWTPEVISSRFILQNRKVLDDALEVGGAIVAMPHMGNYDLAGAWGTVQYGALSTIVERLKPESLYQQFVAHREALGVEILPLGDPDSFRTLVRRARDGGLICLLADRDITHSGVDVDFFGERARMPAGPATLSVLTGAALIPGTLWAEGETNYGRVGEPIPIPESGSRQEKVAAMTQLLANYFEGGIAERPADWHMMQPVFTADFDEAHLDLSGVGDRT